MAAACSTQPPVSPDHTGAVAAAGKGPCSSISISASQGPSITAGDEVTITARAGGCKFPSYRFLLLDAAADSGVVMQDWGISPVW
ncbi:MAG TPA: hypothetical protein VHQ03_09625, partial [Candidatus Dormibacteraeota bacterium]|nr:hypothetical protein [Candidatus Dormibacteraeota bacterium]